MQQLCVCASVDFLGGRASCLVASAELQMHEANLSVSVLYPLTKNSKDNLNLARSFNKAPQQNIYFPKKKGQQLMITYKKYFYHNCNELSTDYILDYRR